MRKNLSAFLLSIFVFGTIGTIYAEDAKQTTTAPALAIENFGGNAADIPGWQPSLGQGISAMLVETLQGSDHKFQVLEPAESAPEEADSGGGKAKSKSATRTAAPVAPTPAASAPTASDFTFGGEVVQFAVGSSGGQVGQVISSSPLAGLGANINNAHVEIAWYVKDTQTRKVIKRGTAEGSGYGAEFDMASVAGDEGTNSAVATAVAKANTAPADKNSARLHSLFSGLTKAFGSNGGGGGAKNSSGSTAQSKTVLAKVGGDSTQNSSGTISYDNAVFMDSALGKATAEAITNLIQQLDAIALPESGRAAGLQVATVALKHTGGKVLAVAGKDAIIVSLGSKQGFKAGDQLELFQTNDIKDDKGNVVFTDEKLVGEITLSEVQEEHSRGSYTGDVEVQQGWTVKAK